MRGSILRTLAYFDIFDYPLTTLEVWKFLNSRTGPTDLGLILAGLETLQGEGVIDQRGGFWFLRGREVGVNLRLERSQIARRKYARARLVTRFLKHLPGIRLVAICNTLAWSQARDESDIDFFIVTKSGRLWQSRFLAVAPFALLGLRPRSGQERDALCFSFFAAETALDFSVLRIKPDDPYLLYWVASLVPLYDPDGLIEAIWEANPWVRQALPNARPFFVSTLRRVSGQTQSSSDRGGEANFWENLARAWQMLRLPRGLREIMNVDHRVLVTDELLKFHQNDRRHEFRLLYERSCQKLAV